MTDAGRRNAGVPRLEYDGAQQALVVRIRLSDVDSEEALASFMESVARHFDGKAPKAVVFDIAELELLSSCVLGGFLQFRQRGAKVALRNASPHVVDTLERTHLNKLLDIQSE